MFSDYLPILFILISGIAAILAGCDSLRNDGEVRGRVEVRLTDAPAVDFDEVLVTIERVELLGHDADGESTLLVLMDEPQVFNLLELRNGASVPLAHVDVPAGSYDQVRLVIGREAEVLLGSGERVRLPNAEERGRKIAIPSFSIASDDDVARVTLDFDTHGSFIRADGQASYVFKPSIRARTLIVNGEDVLVDAEDTSA